MIKLSVYFRIYNMHTFGIDTVVAGRDLSLSIYSSISFLFFYLSSCKEVHKLHFIKIIRTYGVILVMTRQAFGT